ncbi:uncharacterized protein LTR77_010713 [Saxophila tyrrhenica]|uniref:Homeobox domain-containing protein n=1 Tax=Saxophila tyrrhenica TaxID=1690608 RepID=A0AAV9NUQ9_9PEZI|nr:hypothetical protein LTR77_010713 [Saxophila tyrrhenica]
MTDQLGSMYTREAKRKDVEDRITCSGSHRQAFTTALDAIEAELDSDHDDTSSDGDSDSEGSEGDWTKVLSTATFGRRILLPSYQRINVDEIMGINQLYGREKDFLEEAHRTAISRILMSDDGVSSEAEADQGEPQAREHAILEEFRATYGRVRESTDRVTAKDSRLPCATQLGSSLSMSVAENVLLQDFWRICQMPNDAELTMLSVACELPEHMVEDWFCEKSSRKGSYFYKLTKADAMDKALAAETDRKRKLTEDDDEDEGEDTE